jgi:hypothetical protein
MNCVICKKDGTIFRVVKNAIRKGKKIEGETGKWAGKPELFDIVWTEQELIPLEGGGYAETLADINTIDPPRGRVQPELTQAAKREMLERLEDIAEMTFSELDDYIDANVTNLASAKRFLQTHARVTLAAIKLLQDKL